MKNIKGIRNKNIKPNNKFNDKLIFNGKEYSITTYAGFSKLEYAIPYGTAYLKYGFYKQAYCLGLHKGSPALCQYGLSPTKINRFRFGKLGKKIESGYFGINIHGRFLPKSVKAFWLDNYGSDVKSRKVVEKIFSGRLESYAIAVSFLRSFFDAVEFSEKERVYNWSEGCQVFKYKEEYFDFLLDVISEYFKRKEQDESKYFSYELV